MFDDESSFCAQCGNQHLDSDIDTCFVCGLEGCPDCLTYESIPDGIPVHTLCVQNMDEY